MQEPGLTFSASQPRKLEGVSDLVTLRLSDERLQ